MGKLGGRELNDASDVDVLFVHADGADGAEAGRVARAVMTVMTEPTADGIVFRTDADLRPEGRSGPLDCSLDSYACLLRPVGPELGVPGPIKARPVAGDDELARRFMDTIGRHVWPERPTRTRSGRCGR